MRTPAEIIFEYDSRSRSVKLPSKFYDLDNIPPIRSLMPISRISVKRACESLHAGDKSTFRPNLICNVPRQWLGGGGTRRIARNGAAVFHWCSHFHPSSGYFPNVPRERRTSPVATCITQSEC
jgi:hypothetical protein